MTGKETSDQTFFFLSSLSHELRTPINCTKGFIEMSLKDESLDPETRVKMEKALKSTKRMLTMVNDLLDLSILMGSDRMNIHPRWFLLKDIIDPLHEDTSHLFENGEVKFKMEIPDELMRTKVRSDPTRLRQVLINLIENASKYTFRGYVILSVRREESKLAFDVGDTGIGIMEEDLERIFEPFYQASTGHSRRSKGTGIGLALSREIMERLKGKIFVATMPGEGSTFTVEVPIESGDLDMVDDLLLDIR